MSQHRIVRPSERQRLLQRAGLTGMTPQQQQERRSDIQYRLNLERIKLKVKTGQA